MARRDQFTGDLFLVPQPEHPTPGGANYSTEIANLVARMLKACPADRWDVAAQMSRLSGDDVSKNSLDAWAAASRADHNVPFYRVPLFEEVVSSTALTDWLVAKRGGQVAYGRDALNGQLGRLVAAKKQVEAQIKQLQALIGEGEV